MHVTGDYEKNGYALPQGLIAPETAAAFVAMLKRTSDLTPFRLAACAISRICSGGQRSKSMAISTHR
jgi:hypothetical protein